MLARKPHAGVVHVWTGGIFRRQADVVLNRVDVRRRKVADVHPARGCWRTDRYLHGGVAYHEVAENQIALRARRQDDYSVGIPHDDVVDDDVVVHAGINDPYTKVVALGDVTISTQPVRTEPVATGGAGQSYAAASRASVSISNRDVSFEIVVRSAAGDDDPRQAVRRRCDLSDEDPCASPADQDALTAESLNYPRTANVNAALAKDRDSMLAASLAATTSRCGVSPAGYREPLEPE